MLQAIWGRVAGNRINVIASVIVAILAVGVVVANVYFIPEQAPQHWVTVSTGWGSCGTANQGIISWQFCHVKGTFRNDGGTGADRSLPTTDGTYGDVYAYTALFKVGDSETCGAPLDSKTHHGQTETVDCVVAGLNTTTLEPVPLDTTQKVSVEIQSEDYFQGMPSA